MINYKFSNIKKTNSNTAKEYLIFTVAGEEYALDVFNVQQICRYEGIIKMPNTATHVKGIKKLEDKMALVIDLRMLLSAESVSYDNYTIMIILNIENHTFGLVVTEVKEVLTIAEDHINTDNDFKAMLGPYINKISRQSERVIFIIDLEKLFNQELTTVLPKKLDYN